MNASKLKVFVEEFQCPGCTAGSDTSCGCFAPIPGLREGGACSRHTPGTVIAGRGTVVLGLPKGFDITGPKRHYIPATAFERPYIPITFYEKGEKPRWHKLFFRPIWALVRAGFLFVRTFEPRIGRASIVIIEGGTLADAPGADDVSKFEDEMD